MTSHREENSQSKRKTITLVTSQRGKDVVLLNGYRYTKQRTNINGRTVWRCARRNVCGATLVSKGKVVIKQEVHTCGACEAENVVKIKLKRAKTEKIPVPSIYAAVVDKFNNSGFYTVKKIK